MPGAGAAPVPSGCPAPGWGHGTGPACQALPSPTRGAPDTPNAPPQGATSPLSALTLVMCLGHHSDKRKEVIALSSRYPLNTEAFHTSKLNRGHRLEPWHTIAQLLSCQGAFVATCPLPDTAQLPFWEPRKTEFQCSSLTAQTTAFMRSGKGAGGQFSHMKVLCKTYFIYHYW